MNFLEEGVASHKPEECRPLLPFFFADPFSTKKGVESLEEPVYPNNVVPYDQIFTRELYLTASGPPSCFE